MSGVPLSIDSKVICVDDRMMKGVEGEIRDAWRGDVHDVGKKAQYIDDQLDQVNRSLSLQLCSAFFGSGLFTGNRLRGRFLRWLSPSDPSTNHNVALKARHNGTAQWFIQGETFNQWKSTGSLLWICGKRVLFLTFTMR
jgi:hypothetical protein